jgi:hypothetical protein
MILPTTRLSPSDHVFSREFDGELVLLDLDSGVYYGLDAVASDAWKRLCDAHKTVGEAAHEMLERYDVQETTLLADLTALASDWLAKGLAQVQP